MEKTTNNKAKIRATSLSICHTVIWTLLNAFLVFGVFQEEPNFENISEESRMQFFFQQYDISYLKYSLLAVLGVCCCLLMLFGVVISIGILMKITKCSVILVIIGFYGILAPFALLIILTTTTVALGAYPGGFYSVLFFILLIFCLIPVGISLVYFYQYALKIEIELSDQQKALVVQTMELSDIEESPEEAEFEC